MTAKKKKSEQEDFQDFSGQIPEREHPSESREQTLAGDSSAEILSGEGNLEQARREATENYDKYLRLAADFDNYKKRVQKDRSDLLNFGNESLIRDILPTVDSLERALEHSSGVGESTFQEGLRLILEQLQGALSRHGVEAVDALGRDFDPHYHEAMLRVEGQEYRDNQVVEEFEKGYLLKGRLLRPAKVSVAKRSS